MRPTPTGARRRAYPGSIRGGANFGGLKDTHALTTIYPRLWAISKRFNVQRPAWNPSHRAKQQPLQGVLRTHGRPVEKAAALSLELLGRLVATSDFSAFRVAGTPRALRYRRSTAGRRPVRPRCGASCVRVAGLTLNGFNRISGRALRVGFVTKAFAEGMRDEDTSKTETLRHTRQRWAAHHATPPSEARSPAAAPAGAVHRWRLDLTALEEGVFDLAVARPARPRTLGLTIDGCRPAHAVGALMLNRTTNGRSAAAT